jgi:hypothetical protein
VYYKNGTLNIRQTNPTLMVRNRLETTASANFAKMLVSRDWRHLSIKVTTCGMVGNLKKTIRNLFKDTRSVICAYFSKNLILL